MRQATCSWVLTVAGAVVALVSGCDRAWNAYGHAELGTSITGLSVLRGYPPEAQEHAFGLAFAQNGRCRFPLSMEHRRMALLKDDRNRVVARSYCNSGNLWLAVFASMAQEYVAEVEVPAEWFREPPDDWRPEKDWQTAQAAAGEIGRQTAPYTYPPTSRVDVASLRAALGFALKRMSAPTAVEKAEGQGPKCAARYVLACLAAMAGMHDNANSHPDTDVLSRLVRRPQAFRGLTQEGHAVTWREDVFFEGFYSVYSIRNIGGRRIQVRAKWAGLFFPTSYFGYGTVTVSAFQGYAPGGTRVSE